MWTNISASTKLASDLELEVKRDSKSGEVTVKSNPSETKRNSVDIDAGKKCGSPPMRYKHAVCSAQDGFIYIHGGRFGNLPLDDDIWRFDPHHNTWARLVTSGQRPPSLQEHTLVEYGRDLYLFGGQVSAPSAENSFWRLSLATCEWQSLDLKSSRKFGAYLGPTNRRGHSAVVYGTSMFVYGGFEDFRGSSGQLWEYEFANRRWLLRDLSSTSARQPEPRHSHSAIVHADSMYIYGGLSNLKSMGDLWRWSWTERRWFKEKTRGSSPGQLHGHAAIQAFGSMFVFGGERADGRPTRSLWRLNLSNMIWQKIRSKGPRPSPTTWHGAIANPLNMLDEANYIIEGDHSLATLPRSTLSDTSLSVSIKRQNNRASTIPKLCNSRSKLEELRTKKMDETSPSSSMSPPDLDKLNTRGKRLKLSFLRGKQNSKSQERELKQVPPQSNSAVVETNPNPSETNKPITADEMKNSNILDSLDSDIKKMFQHALKPDGDDSESIATLENSKSSKAETRLSLLTNGQFETANSLTNSNHVSQRTSLGAYVTPPSELASLKTQDGPTKILRRDRPKSEIVQSLIDRADARIKHLYTPLFNNQALEISSKLKQRRENQFRFTQPNAKIRPERFSLDARTKHHAIPQTMTYYNLYFSEDKTAEHEDAKKIDDHPERFEEDEDEYECKPELTRDDSSFASTIKGIGVLVGVHGSGASSSGNRTRELTDELSSSAESDTRTLRVQNQVQSSQASSTLNANALSSLHSALTTREQTENEITMNVDEDLLSPTRTGSAADNTSLSFSAIAEFEEDDMLQYSSPTEPNVTAFHSSNRQTVILGPSSNQPNAEIATETEHHPVGRVLTRKSASSGYGDSISAGKNSELTTSPLSNNSNKLMHAHNERADISCEEGGSDARIISSSNSVQSGHIRRIEGHDDSHSYNYEAATYPQDAPTSSSMTTDSLLMTSDLSAKTGAQSLLVEQEHNNQATHSLLIRGNLQSASCSASRLTSRPKLFSKRKSKTRYWQLCMFVIGGKQGDVHGSSEPITVWRLYI